MNWKSNPEKLTAILSDDVRVTSCNGDVSERCLCVLYLQVYR